MATNCNNILQIIGNRDEIINFLYDFYDGSHICKMNNILPYEIEENIKYLGNDDEILYSDSLTTVLSNNKRYNKRKFSYIINYTTKDYTNDLFIKKVSELCPKFKMILIYHNDNKLISGKKIFQNGKENTIAINCVNNINDNKEIINYYDFLLDENILTLYDMDKFLRLKSNKIKNYFINKLENMDLIYDFEDLEKEYYINNIVNPK